MAPDPCASRGPLSHSGTTQDSRGQPGLATDYFRPDERDLADLILFGKNFAKHLQYYGADNRKDGDWSVFFNSDVTAALAALSKLPIEEFRQQQQDLELWLSLDDARDPAELSAHTKLVFHLPLVALEQTAAELANLPLHHDFRGELITLFSREFEQPLADLISWYKGGLDVSGPATEVFADTPPDTADYNLDGSPGNLKLKIGDILALALRVGRPAFSMTPLSDLALSEFDQTSWGALYATRSPDPSPYQDAAAQPNRHYEQIYDLLNYNLFNSAVERIYTGLTRVRSTAAQHLQVSLNEFSEHSAQFGLWLAFLKVFGHAQAELNRFSERHMTFYFRDILRLANNDAVPDKAHLVFELAKGQANHLLPAGTLFRAEKDALGNPVSYALNNDIVVNQAQVAQLQSVRISETNAAPGLSQQVLCATEVRSRDGLGEIPLSADRPDFGAFGPTATPSGRVGFAVSDRKLFLREGNRTITLRAVLPQNLPHTSLAPRWRVRLSGTEGWFELSRTDQISTLLSNNFASEHGSATNEVLVSDAAQKGAKKINAYQGGGGTSKTRSGQPAARGGGAVKYAGNTKKPAPGHSGYTSKKPTSQKQKILQITVILTPDDPGIVPLDADLHGTEHAPGVPVMEVLFDFEHPETHRAFTSLRDLRFGNILLKCSVEKIGNLRVLADGADVDPAKSFEPFGARPRSGTTWHIGSSEIFSKSIATWDLKLQWEKSYYSSGYFKKTLADSYNPTEWILAGGEWQLADPPETKTTPEGYGYSTLAGEADLGLDQSNPKVELAGGYLIDAKTPQTLENPALTTATRNGFLRMSLPTDFGHGAHPKHMSLALIDKANGDTYTAPSWVNLDTEGLPKEPFVPTVTSIEASYATTLDPIEYLTHLHPFGTTDGALSSYLFPQFPFEAALYLGIEKLSAPAKLNLLVQVADGSGDPLISPPDLAFDILTPGGWQALRPQDVDDKTENFSTSAVLGLNLPEVLQLDYPEMPIGLYWIRLSVKKDHAASNRLLEIAAQAAQVSFVDAGNDPAFLATPLPAQTIAKFQIPEPAVKKIRQPYSSFGGRPSEPGDEFRIRTAERLRHKNRATTIWDYETLVLQAFPKLYRAKCLSTTELKRNGLSKITGDNENMPGAVTLVTVPWTHGKNSRNPLRPYTDQATLRAVDKFLRSRISPFVHLEVQNPKFEEVHLKFNVCFRPEIGDIAYYTNALDQALVAYLSPWSQPGGGDITFGGNLWKSTIIDFVDEWPHVDYVTDFQMFHKVDPAVGDGDWTPIDTDVVQTTTARSILVSAPSHIIDEVGDE